MKLLKPYLFTVFLMLLNSCSSDSDNNADRIAKATSMFCNDITGANAIYWDYANGVAPPFSRVPVLQNPGQQFLHPHPSLGFVVPQGYTASADQRSGAIGANVIRNDNAAVWRYAPLATFPGNFSVNDILASEINGMFNFYGFNDNFNVLCSETRTVNQGNIVTVFNARLIQFGNFTGLVWVNVTAVQGLSTLSVAASVSSGPTAEYNNLVMDVFFPLSYQLLVNDRGSLSDRDNDGTPDVYDNFPDDPTRQ
ncbi:MAG: hypothetical protein ACK5NB_04885 [Flavobacteriaceae bacterium]